MVNQITLTLSDSALQRAADLAALVSRPLEAVLAETLEISLPDIGAPSIIPPIASLDDPEVLALARIRMENQQSTRMSDLLNRQQAGVLSADERVELNGLYQAYLRLWLRQSEALAEAVHRGLCELPAARA